MAALCLQEMRSRVVTDSLVKLLALAVLGDARLSSLFLWMAWFLIVGQLHAMSGLCQDRLAHVRAPPAAIAPPC